MSSFKILKKVKEKVEIYSFNDFCGKIHLIDNLSVFNEFQSIIETFEKKPVGYKSFNLSNATKIRICVNETRIFKPVSTLSKLETLSKYIYDNHEEVIEINHKFDFIKTQINVFVDNYKPFDFFKFQEKRTEFKVNISYVENNETKIIKTNLGELLAIYIRREQFDCLDYDHKSAQNKQVNRKYNPEYMPSFKISNVIMRKDNIDPLKEYRGKEYIFEFSNKSYYKELIDMINY